MSWALDGGFSTPEPFRNPRLSIRCEYPETADTPETPEAPETPPSSPRR